jgi:polar amino acid transport system substrate-binding protein
MKLLHIVYFLVFLLCGWQETFASEKIVLLNENAWLPYSGEDKGQSKGFAVDVIRAAYTAVNVEVEFKSVPYTRCLEMVRKQQNLGCFNSSKNKDMLAQFLFHQKPIFRAQLIVVAMANHPEEQMSLNQLDGRKVGLTRGYVYGLDTKMMKDWMIDEAPSDLSNLRKLLIGRNEFFLIYSRVYQQLVNDYANEFENKFKKVASYSEREMFVSFSKTSESLKFAHLLDQGLDAIRANGTYEKIEKMWWKDEK